MKKTQKKLNPLLFSLLCCILSLPILAFAGAFIIMRLENPSASLTITALMLFPVCGSLSAVLTTRYKGENAVKEGLIASFSTSILIILLGLIFSHGALSASVLISSCVFILSNLCISYLARPKSRRHKRHRGSKHS